MLKEMVRDLTEEQLKILVERMITTCPEIAQKAMMETYYEIYGCHFNKTLLKIALSKMINEDGSTGAKWTVEQTNSVAKEHNITFDHFNEYDWNYVMNMIYSDYYGAISDETSSYAKLAKKFLCDKDASKGKAIKYFFAMAF